MTDEQQAVQLMLDLALDGQGCRGRWWPASGHPVLGLSRTQHSHLRGLLGSLPFVACGRCGLIYVADGEAEKHAKLLLMIGDGPMNPYGSWRPEVL